MQHSFGPSTAKFTPALISNLAMERVTFCARRSNDPAQPIHHRISKSGWSLANGTSSPSAHAKRSACGKPHGLPLVCIWRIEFAADPASAPSAARSRRSSNNKPSGSTRTGQAVTQALHEVHAQTVSALIVSPCSATDPPLAVTSINPFKSCTTALGESGLPEANAGHASSQRPHSMQASRLNSCCWSRCAISETPTTPVSSTSSMEIGANWPSDGVEKNKFAGPVMK